MDRATPVPEASHLVLGREIGQDARQLLVDISGTVYRKDYTGVHRVVHGLLKELMAAPPPGYSVHPVYIDRCGQFRYHDLGPDHPSRASANDGRSIVQVRPGDLYFTADLFYPYPFSVLKAYAAQGLRTIFTVHDIIPLQYPHYFMKFSRIALRDWLTGIAQNAYGIVCVSHAAAVQLRSWILEHEVPHSRPLRIGFFHNGVNFENFVSVAAENDLSLVKKMCAERPSFLMVGTLLPYKGHAQVLSAMERLWNAGIDCNLVIIGKEGWRSHLLADRLRRHKERGRRLFWLESASDAMLVQLYKSTSCLIAASEAEGFGLPLIEAAHYGLSILARDIPVFREVGQGYAEYFCGNSPELLADAIQHRLSRKDYGNIAGSDTLPWQSWAASKDQLLRVILNDQWSFLCE